MKPKNAPEYWLFIRVRSSSMAGLERQVAAQNKIYRTVGHALFSRPLATIKGPSPDERFLVVNVKHPPLPLSHKWPFRWFGLGMTYAALVVSYYLQHKGTGVYTITSGRRLVDTLIGRREVRL